MSHPHHNGQYVRRVVLPSGRAIEVVYFESLARRRADRAAAARRSTICTSAPSATATLVTRSSGRRPPRRTGRSSCAAPTASGPSVGVFDQPTVDRFDEELDHGTEALMRDLKRLTQANMEDEIERFAAALDADAILPEDF